MEVYMRGGGSEGVVGEPVAQDRQAYCSIRRLTATLLFFLNRGEGETPREAKCRNRLLGLGSGILTFEPHQPHVL